MFPGPSCGKPDDTLDFLREVLFSRRLFEEFHKYQLEDRGGRGLCEKSGCLVDGVHEDRGAAFAAAQISSRSNNRYI